MQQQAFRQDLNLQPVLPTEVDLNVPAQEQDDNPQEVILNLAQPLGDFLEVNDLLEENNVVEEVFLAQEFQNNLPPPMIAEEQQLLNLADDELHHDVPMLPANHIAMQVEDAPLDQLVDFENELNLPDDLIEDQVVPPEQ